MTDRWELSSMACGRRRYNPSLSLNSYSVDPGDTELPIGCVLKSTTGMLNREDVLVERINQLDSHLGPWRQRGTHQQHNRDQARQQEHQLAGLIKEFLVALPWTHLTFAGRTTFLRRRWRTGVFSYPRAIICKIKWLKVEKIQNNYMIYGMWIAKIDGVKMRTLPHTHFLQTKHVWHHYFEI